VLVEQFSEVVHEPNQNLQSGPWATRGWEPLLTMYRNLRLKYVSKWWLFKKNRIITRIHDPRFQTRLMPLPTITQTILFFSKCF